jgi:hypothetical protein
MEMARIVLEGVIGRQVHAAAEPPHGFFAFLFGDEEAHVHVRGRAIRVARMQYQRDAHGFPAAAGELGPVGGGGGGHLLAHDV